MMSYFRDSKDFLKRINDSLLSLFGDYLIPATGLEAKPDWSFHVAWVLIVIRRDNS